MDNIFKDKTILVTGGTGSIGSELVAQLLAYEPKQIRIFSRDESKQYYLLEKLNHPKNIRLLIGDVRDKERLSIAFKNVNYVFHAAAMKHVPLCEYNPVEAVKTNILGSQNVIDVAIENNVEKVIAISTDKAVKPSNVLGTTKLMMEKLFVNESYYTSNNRTKLSCVRFGNVLWSRGSVLHLWKNQAEKDSSIKLTNGEMTRFFMSQAQAVGLILKATQYTQGGEIFILKMPAIQLSYLAEIFIKKYFPDKKMEIKIIGCREGEKEHEELVDCNDTNKYIYENEELYIIVPSNIEVYNAPFGAEENFYFKHGFKKIDIIEKFCSLDNINHELIREII
ncbi:MAG: Polysaccharide biosynthesis protein CapD [Parcubacteria group bacterium GW2011_GWA2_38_13]|nr:MAG: Polysaccharide biosynthesis protein CapD [Parcubacteria group bacterium GW2011_GWA2_38_13]